MREEDIAGGEISRVQVVDMGRKCPAQYHETSQFRPCAISNKECVGANIEWRSLAKVTAPQPNGAYVPEMGVQHIHDHTQHAGKIAVSISYSKSTMLIVVKHFFTTSTALRR